MDQTDRFRGALLGLAAGDAVGTTVEFMARGTFAPVTDMTGGGPFQLAAGQWTDDTSMALCLAASLVERGRFDARDQVERYCRWMDTGYMSSNGRCFDIGVTVRSALARFKRKGDPFAGSTDPHSAGNGSLMRLAPVVLFFHPDQEAAIHHAGESSKTTHAAAEAVEACQLFGALLCQALDGATKDGIARCGERVAQQLREPKVVAIAAGGYRHKRAGDVKGTGYVIASLEAALWAFHTTDSFEGAILAAANLGDDADTTAAICGQIAGAFYGESGIPSRWLNKLTMREQIGGFAMKLHAAEPSP
jgi:ADP-ribosyl-[dinitrogen reductase] hydrolase